MLFENKVSGDFADKVKSIGSDLNISPDILMACMGFETGYTYDPAIRNSIGATGLIQFLKSTALKLGTTTDLLAQMDAVSQLDYVKLYYQNVLQSYPVNSLTDAYLAIFYPAAMGKDDNYQLPANVYKANSGFDTDRKGYITKGDIGKFINFKTARNSGEDISGIVGNTDVSTNDLWTGFSFRNVSNFQLWDMGSYNTYVILGAALLIGILLVSVLISFFKTRK